MSIFFEFRDDQPSAVEMPQAALLLMDGELLCMALTAILKHQVGFAEVIRVDRVGGLPAPFKASLPPSLAVVDVDGLTESQNALSDNLKALGDLRRSFPGIQVVLTCNAIDRRAVLQALSLGIKGVLPKTLGADEWVQAIRSILNGAIYVPSPVAATLHESPAELGATARPRLSAGNGLPCELTPRQRDVLELLVYGKSNKEIARSLGLSESTIKIHLAAMFRSLGVTSRAGAAVTGSDILRRETSSPT